VAASDHLSPGQFIHGTKHKFNEGDVLSVEGANVAKYGQEGYQQRLARGWQDKHIYYADHSLMGDVSGMYAGEGGHMYAVQPETKTGKPVTKNSPDPNYRNYGGGAYRTTGNLRVLHEIDEHGNKL
jgi:hypothetical protein